MPASRSARASSFAEIVRAEARRIRLGMGLLATIGATSPFVGLFGTVWGIMNSFIGISKSQTTNLAVVAPGIAEALLATAIGLVAAIPAVIIYNHFSRVTKGYLELVSRASGAAGRLLSRDLDRTHVSGGQRSRARRSRRWALRSQIPMSMTTAISAETHDINVTPFIDVILVLLIIFMVAAPLSTVDLPIDLPTSTATPQKKPDKPTYVSIKPDLAVAIGENLVKRVDLVRSLDAMPDMSKDRHIFLRADRAVPYGELMDVLEILRAGGYAKIKLVALEGVPDRGGAGGAGKALTRPRRSKSRPGGSGFSPRSIALALHVGGAALAIAHLQTDESDDALGASGDRGRPRTGVGAPRRDRPAAGPGHRCFRGFAAARRAKGRGQGNRAAAGQADRDRRSRIGW